MDGETAAQRAARLEEEEAKQREAELEVLQSELDGMRVLYEQLCKQQDLALATVRQLEAEAATARTQTAPLERAVLVKRRTLEMLPDAANNTRMLQQICSQSAERLMRLAAEWEKHRRPLVDAIRAQREGLATRREQCRFKVQEMKRMRAEMQEMAARIREREETARTLSAEYAAMPKGKNRAFYTMRIMDIIKQVRKQKAEIARVIGDIRAVQKEINTVSDTLRRTEAIADERVYQAAAEKRKEPAFVQAYRLLSLLRQHFESLINVVQDSGRVDNEIRDLTQRCEQIATRNTALNMERVQSDLQEVRAENERMSSALGK